MLRLLMRATAPLFAALVWCSAQAATFSAQRGINLDLWTSWPDESAWSDPAVILPFPEWRRSLDARKLEALREAGFDFARMPVDPAVLLSEQTVELRERLVADILRSSRLVRAARLKVIVDLHAIPAGANRAIGTDQILSEPALFDRYVEMVATVAESLAGEDPRRLALELFNEPTLDCAAENDWPTRLLQLTEAARAAAPELTLVLSGACWGGADGLAGLDPAAFPANVIWSFHTYTPFVLTHQGATWAGDFAPYVTGIPYPPYAVPRADLDAAVEKVKQRIWAEAPVARRPGLSVYLDEQVALVDTAAELETVMAAPFEQAAAWAKQHGVAPDEILLGEFGMIRQEWGNPYVMPGQWRAAYVRDMVGLAERYGFGWSVFAYGGAFGLVEGFGGEPAEPDVIEALRALPAPPPEGLRR